MLQCIWGYRYLFEIVISFSLDILPEVELLDHKVVLFLILWGTSIRFSMVALPTCIPINSVQRFPFLHISSTLVIFSLLDNSHSNRYACITVRLYLTVLLICIPLMVSDVEPLSINLLAIGISSLEKCLFRFFAYFLIGFFNLLLHWALQSPPIRWGQDCVPWRCDATCWTPWLSRAIGWAPQLLLVGWISGCALQ